ncbi:hypothetical protein [Achromobacter sp.]|uniref:hypothetical protein n=1 Tax=Achromobacter sp. TaxID=134375 RepID=UPI0028ACF713|nr:hypothetical protein [Achromobacter sp.]
MASAPVAGEAQPNDAEVMKVYAETVAEYADGRGFEAGTVAFARSLLRRYAAPQAREAARNQALDWNAAWRDSRARAAALEEAARVAESTVAGDSKPDSPYSVGTAKQAAARIRALKTQADKDGGDCAKGAGEVAMRDAAFEAVRKQLCKLPRYSFLSDGYGAVRRVKDSSGSWIGFDAAHVLFDPVCVDAALSAQPSGNSGELAAQKQGDSDA